MAKSKISTPYNVYVDVGGTTTRLVVTDLSKRILKKISGPSAILSLRTEIKKATKSYPRRPEHLIVGIRGVWASREKDFWARKLKDLATNVSIMSDVELAHRLVFGHHQGILLNAGTGSIAYGRFRGRMARAGGLGPLLGDEGSGFWIGKQFLLTTYRRDRRLEKIRRFVKSSTAVTEISGLARKVLVRSDALSKKIVREAQDHLFNLVQEVRSQLHWKGPISLKLVGGLFKNKNFKNAFLVRFSKKEVVDY